MQQNRLAQTVSEHFKLHQIAEGVHAAIATDGGAAFSNAGIIDLGDQTLIFDTFESHVAAYDMRIAAERLTGRPASYVINSHAHDDHWMGNQIFAEHAPILSTCEIRQAIDESAAELRDLQADPTELFDEIREYKERLHAETDDRIRSSLVNIISRYRHNLDMLPSLELFIPNLTFEKKLVFHGPLRIAELLTKGAGHTSSDCYILLPADKIAFLGDIAFFQCQPFMAYCDPQAWVSQLEALERADYMIFVPGHGPLGTKKDIALERQYISELEEQIALVLSNGGNMEDALAISLPEPFDAWVHAGRGRFESNVRSSYQRQSGEKI